MDLQHQLLLDKGQIESGPLLCLEYLHLGTVPVEPILDSETKGQTETNTGDGRTVDRDIVRKMMMMMMMIAEQMKVCNCLCLKCH